MSERTPAVALLFEDKDLGNHLRVALQECGARIVYDTSLASFASEALLAASADVVVVNLDNPSDADLDRLYDAVDGDEPRLVFNDADVSRGLAGWDKARWARHLASKVLVGFDIDPPRPEGAREIELHTVAVGEPVAEPVHEEVFASHVDEHGLLDDLELEMSLAEAKGNETDADAETLEAELEALLAASDDQPADAAFDLSIGAVAFDDQHDAEPVAAFESNDFAETTDAGDDVAMAAPLAFDTSFEAALEAAAEDVTVGEEAAVSAPVAAPVFDLSRFELASMDDETKTGTDVEVSSSVVIEKRETEIVLAPPPEWDLVDGDAVTVEVPVKPAEPNPFGIETLSAAEFLAQDAPDDGSLDFQAGLSLELVSIEEAIAPRTDGDFAHEMFLEGHSAAIRRLVALGATRDSAASVRRFLAAIPRGFAGLVLLVHHIEEGADQELLASLSAASQLPVTLAIEGARANQGNVLLVPRGQQISLRRDGLISLRADDAAPNVRSPSIDAIFSTAAQAFGADALAIVFAGRANDAVAGAQAIHDRGGRVWIEEPEDDHPAEMVAGIREERIVSFSGSVDALAEHLIQEFP
ncbi:MAG TPA: chemotaxis protein CheB [Luteibacter sp.]|jgi:chemosensory pili system protein ChpB (putative protein-glutamate methylesterase)|nr:chemotaxis protein CheB [Luteibacter sp.]